MAAAAAGGGELFPLTTRLREVVRIANAVPADMLGRVLQRIVRRLHLKDEAPFTPAELQRMVEMMSLKEAELNTLLEGAAFVYEQAAYSACAPPALEAQLKHIGCVDEVVTAFVSLWTAERPALIDQLRGRTIVPLVLDDVSWRLHLQLAQRGMSRVKTPSALFQLALRNTESTGGAEVETLTFEMSHEQLYRLYGQMEQLQDQLDTLQRGGGQ